MKAKVILLMGVSSSGKTTIGERLSQQLGWPFYDGDLFHTPANVEKMRSGTPLTDEDRLPWLQGMHEKINSVRAAGTGAIFACSALKERYRDILLRDTSNVVLIHLVGSREKIVERARARVHQYMPASLVDSQFESLEVPKDALTVSVEGEVDDALGEIIAALEQELER